jgi:selenocysteine lyase/cysteine desulfurase
VLWGRRSLLEELPVYKLRPVPDTLPGRWMTGTQNHEGLAGVRAAVEYLAQLGGGSGTLRERLVASMSQIQQYERALAARLLEGLSTLPRCKVWGITDTKRLGERVPTVSITLGGQTPRQVAEQLAARQIYVWDGNVYALALSERLQLEPHGFVRLGFVHYNTRAEVDGVLDALQQLS